MKNTFIVLLLFIFPLNSFAQNYVCKGKYHLDKEKGLTDEYYLGLDKHQKFGIEVKDKYLKIYNRITDPIRVSLESEGKYLETRNSVRAESNQFYISVFQHESVWDDIGNISGRYVWVDFDKITMEFNYTVQSWNHKTRGKNGDLENVTYYITSKCEKL